MAYASGNTGKKGGRVPFYNPRLVDDPDDPNSWDDHWDTRDDYREDDSGNDQYDQYDHDSEDERLAQYEEENEAALDEILGKELYKILSH